jgi:hypothetical protein
MDCALIVGAILCGRETLVSRGRSEGEEEVVCCGACSRNEWSMNAVTVPMRANHVWAAIFTDST